MRDSRTLGQQFRWRWPEKIAWMVENRHLWEHVVLKQERFKRAPESLYMTERPMYRAVASGLKNAGLIARSTGTIDVPVRALIEAASLQLSKTKNTE